MRTAVLMAILSGFLLSLAACGNGVPSGTKSVIPGENGVPANTQPAK
jgi:hypothetical protein